MWANRDGGRNRDRFDKFDTQARKALSLAQEEAQRFQHNYIGTEHLLLGLVRLEDSVSTRVLNSLGVELNSVRKAVEFIIGRGDRIVLGEIGLTPRAKKVIELAVEETSYLGHYYIGTEHLLLGLVREGEGIASGVLESMGISLDRVRVATLEVLGMAASESSPPRSGEMRGVQMPLLALASEYVRGEREADTTASSIQDADDLVPPPTSNKERGNRFSIRARRVLSRAHVEAQEYQAETVGTEHLLLALIREENGIAYHLLRGLGIEHERIQTAIQFLIVEEHLHEPGNLDGLTEDAKEALEMTIEEAGAQARTAIGTEHLLLGLLRCEGMAAGVLVTRGLTLEKVRAEISRLGK